MFLARLRTRLKDDTKMKLRLIFLFRVEFLALIFHISAKYICFYWQNKAESCKKFLHTFIVSFVMFFPDFIRRLVHIFL